MTVTTPYLPPLNYTLLNALVETHPATEPIYMLNLWQYRATASYAPNLPAAVDASPTTGRGALDRYIAALQPIFPPNTTNVLLSNVAGVIAGIVNEDYDDVLITRFDSLRDYVDMVESKVYLEEVVPHRLAGLSAFKFMALENVTAAF